MNIPTLAPPRGAAFRSVQLLVRCYLGISVIALIAIIALRNDSAAVNSAVWVRGTIVVVSAAFMAGFAARASHGHRRSYLRLRLVSAIMVVAIAVIITLPGTFPLWLKIEQAVCGLLLLAVVVIVNRSEVRSAFAAE